MHECNEGGHAGDRCDRGGGRGGDPEREHLIEEVTANINQQLLVQSPKINPIISISVRFFSRHYSSFTTVDHVWQ